MTNALVTMYSHWSLCARTGHYKLTDASGTRTGQYELTDASTRTGLTLLNLVIAKIWRAGLVLDHVADKFLCPMLTIYKNTLENTMVEHTRTPLEFNESMSKVIDYVQVTTSINISHAVMTAGY